MADRSADTPVDVVIVGAGPSGSVVAHHLAQRGLSVVCLEQGDWVDPSAFPGSRPDFELRIRTQWSCDPNVRRHESDYPVGVEEADVHPIMFNAVGGSSLLYGAQWMRLLPSDFRVRTLDGVADDWPISYDDVDPFYQEVDAFMGISGLGGDPAYPPQDFPLPPHPIGPGGIRAAAGMNALGWHWWPGTNAIPPTAFKRMEQCVRWGTCERGCPVGAKASFDRAYTAHAVAEGAKLVTGARVARVATDASGLANGVIWLDRTGVEHRIRSNAVVLAANGVGTPRLLLMSGEPGEGLANSSGLVGKNLMMHPNCGVTGIYEEALESWNGPAGQLLYSLQFYETDLARGFSRGAKWNLMPIPGVLEVLALSRNLPFEERWGEGLHRRSRLAGNVLSWVANIDDLPEESNQVTLHETLTDSSGLPAPSVRYRISENTQRNLDFQLDRMAEAHRAAGAIETHDLPLWVATPGHLLGTVRMGRDPRRSVVDPYGRSHDIPNLFVVDGSVMVTGGGVNPTASIAALALRTARHLADTASDQRAPA
jgi:choline dehydrogenase-like flavoprotein